MQAHPPNPEVSTVGTTLFSFANPVIQAFLAACAAVVLDWLAGILVSFKLGTFNVGQIPRQLATTWLPLIGGLVVVAIAAEVATLYPGFIQGTGYVTLLAAIVAVGVKALYDIVLKAQTLLGSSAAPATAQQTQPAPQVIVPR
jgi:hypothetical protein